jgi:hypothetical protein
MEQFILIEHLCMEVLCVDSEVPLEVFVRKQASNSVGKVFGSVSH